MLAACLPTLKPLFALALPHLFRSTLANLSSGRQYRADKYGGGGQPTTRSRLGPAVKAGGVGAVYVKDVDEDMTALTMQGEEDRGSFGSAGRDIEMPAYQVSVTGGSPRVDSRLDNVVRTPTGIHTTTVVTQRVDSL